MDPLMMLKQAIAKSGIPQTILKNMLAQHPLVQNLINFAKKGDEESLKTFGRNFFKERGRDFDKEYQNFMTKFK